MFGLVTPARLDDGDRFTIFYSSSCHRQIDMDRDEIQPNQSPEPTAVGAAVAIHAASRRWLSFGR